MVPWLPYGLGLSEGYHSVYHMIGTVQAGLTCLLAGLVLRGLPLATGMPAARPWRGAVIGVATTGTALTAWFRFALPNDIMLGVSEGLWLVAVGILAHSTWPRLSGPDRRLWFATSLVFGLAGAAMVTAYSVYQLSGRDLPWLVRLGRGFLLQGMVLAALLAALPDLLPALLGGRPVRGAGGAARRRAPVLPALLLTASFPIEVWVSLRLGLGLRGAIVLAAILRSGGAARGRLSGLAASVSLALWLIPVGYGLAALLPRLRTALLHLVLLGGFVLGSCTVALWTCGRGGAGGSGRLARRAVAGPLAVALVAAVVARVLADVLTSLQRPLLAVSAAACLGGLLWWLRAIVTPAKARV